MVHLDTETINSSRTKRKGAHRSVAIRTGESGIGSLGDPSERISLSLSVVSTWQATITAPALTNQELLVAAFAPKECKSIHEIVADIHLPILCRLLQER